MADVHRDSVSFSGKDAGSRAAPAGDEAERALGRAVSWGIPTVTFAAALLVGVLGSLGSALLLLASGALLGAISLVWASLRTLSGDAPLADDVAGEVAPADVSELGERKRRVLLALKDLESEHALGKIDDHDYEHLVEKYREEAKRVLRAIDERAEPSRAEAERVAAEFLARHGARQESGQGAAASIEKEDRLSCPKCRRENETDASFCKHCGAPMTGVRGAGDATA